MRKNIIKKIIATTFIIGAIISFNLETYANVADQSESKCNYIKRTNTKCICKGTGDITCTC